MELGEGGNGKGNGSAQNIIIIFIIITIILILGVGSTNEQKHVLFGLLNLPYFAQHYDLYVYSFFLQMTLLHFSIWLSNIPWCACVCVCVQYFIYSLVIGVSAVSTVWLL
jgi:Ca2+/Na+ antiporter